MRTVLLLESWEKFLESLEYLIIENLNQLLIKGEKMPKVSEYIKYLQEAYEDDEIVAIDIWGVEDILNVADSAGKPQLPPDVAADILDSAASNIDANEGLTWELFEEAVSKYFSN
jgi:hypothetical protein